MDSAPTPPTARSEPASALATTAAPPPAQPEPAAPESLDDAKASTKPTRENLIKAAQMQNLESVEAILEAGDKAALVAVAKAEGTWGACHHESALHSAIFGLKRGAEESERRTWREIMRALLAAGASPNDEFAHYDWRGCGETETAFALVLQRGALEDLALLQMFLDAGADPTVAQRSSTHSMRTDASSSRTPLHTVVARGVAVDCAIALLRAGADVNARQTERMQNERGFGQDLSETALHLAVARRSVGMCAVLLGHGADVDAVRRSLHTEHLPDVASPTSDPRDPDFVPSVRLVPVEQTALHMAITAGDPDLVRLLVLHKADKRAEQSFGGAKKTAEALCAEHAPALKERLLTALDAKWSPDTHKLFPEAFRASVRATLLTAQRQGWGLPSEVLGDIFGSAA